MIKLEDILGRDIVKPDSELIRKSIYKSVVFVSGAGGSIGSELCKQIIMQKPESLILLDTSSTTSDSRKPPIPIAPGSGPPWPGSITTENLFLLISGNSKKP